MDLELVGQSGELRALYQQAASFGQWRLSTIGPDLFRLDAVQAVGVQAWLSYRPLTLRIPVGARFWEFEVTGHVKIEDDEDLALQVFVSGDPRVTR